MPFEIGEDRAAPESPPTDRLVGIENLNYLRWRIRGESDPLQRAGLARHVPATGRAKSRSPSHSQHPFRQRLPEPTGMANTWIGEAGDASAGKSVPTGGSAKLQLGACSVDETREAVERADVVAAHAS